MKKYLPTYVYSTIYDIDFVKLYALGKKIIMTDLDNTLLPYHQEEATKELIEWRKKINELGFRLYIISNNVETRIMKVVKSLNADGYLAKAHKPQGKEVNHFLQKMNFEKNEVIFIGDQILTDIACANNVGIDSLLVRTIDFKHQKWYTKINRLREKAIIKKIKNFDYQKALIIENLYKEKSR